MSLMKSSTAAWAGAAALVPYAVMKTYWAFGGTAGKPAGDLAVQLKVNGAPRGRPYHRNDPSLRFGPSQIFWITSASTSVIVPHVPAVVPTRRFGS